MLSGEVKGPEALGRGALPRGGLEEAGAGVHGLAGSGGGRGPAREILGKATGTDPEGDRLADEVGGDPKAYEVGGIADRSGSAAGSSGEGAGVIFS
jgi:hypothetical protein